jgi:hypothetical protein
MVNSDEQFEWLRTSHERLQEDVTKIREDVAVLKFKAGVWGLLGGSLPVAIILILWLLKECR